MITTTLTGGAGIALTPVLTVVGAAAGGFVTNITEQLLNGTDINGLDIKGALKSAGLSAGFSLVSLGLGNMVCGAFEFTPSGHDFLNYW